MSKKVTVLETIIVIPTYAPSEAEKCPLFIEKRAYQGSTGKVYPLPVTEKISNEKKDVEYKALILENDYLQVVILPEIGGKIYRAYDKTNGYDFVYYNRVMKPALVGLVGPWVSGGIEFNWPQHHRPTTYAKVNYHYTNNEDGSCSVFVGETDRMYGTKGMAKISLYPDKAYIEIEGQVYNPTDLPQTFLWWANPAVAVNDYTYSVFPPDVNAVFDHGKRAVSTFPIATGEYYKYDYSEGIDISRYKNVKVPTSYMAAHSNFDFIGNYDESVQAGLLHVADHHISPGKKQWTWGNGDFGRSWDKNLTDEDGPYIELMTGVYTDNQPDFTWLKPHEEKTFVQYFMPYKGVGRVLNATKDAMVGLECKNRKSRVKIYATSIYQNAEVTIENNAGKLGSYICELSPEKHTEFELSQVLENTDYEIAVRDCNGNLLVRCKEYKKQNKPIPAAEELLKQPSELKSCEELYLAGEHLEQYRHATFDPAEYYLEGLRRDPTDIRLNNAYGLLLYKNGQIKESVDYFQKAIKKQTWKTPNPYLGESYFNLGVALETLGEYEKAYDAFYKATWSDETRGTGYFHLACIKARAGEYLEALQFARTSLVRNWHDIKTRGLILALNRKLNRMDRAFFEESLAIDPLAVNFLYEIGATENNLSRLQRIAGENSFNYTDLAFEYASFGMYDEVVSILSMVKDNPMAYYQLAYAKEKLGKREEAIDLIKKGEACNADYCFPNRLEELALLEWVIRLKPDSAKANYYLGNLYYDKKQYMRAKELWERAVELDESFAMAYRNLSIVYFNKTKDGQAALAAIENACRLEPDYPRFLLECDQLKAKLGFSMDNRLKSLKTNIETVKQRDDLYLRYITLLNSTEEYEQALACIKTRTFHPWEGGEGKVSGQYKTALIGLAKKKMAQGLYQDAIELLFQTIRYPENLGEGKLPNVSDNEAYYYIGLAYRAIGDNKKAEEYLQRASKGDLTPSSVLYYNDQSSEYIYYAGLAFRELKDNRLSNKAFNQLISFGERHIFDKVDYDYFAVSLPEIEVYQDDLLARNRKYCKHLAALGYAGLGDRDRAKNLVNEILEEQPDEQGALILQSMLK